MGEKSLIVEKIEKELNRGTKIIVYDLDDENLLRKICDEIKCRSQILIWTTCKFDNPGECIEHIDGTSMRSIMSLYNLYDFSDKVVVISDSTQYGSLFNYVNTGVLSSDEMVKALLYKI